MPSVQMLLLTLFLLLAFSAAADERSAAGESAAGESAAGEGAAGESAANESAANESAADKSTASQPLSIAVAASFRPTLVQLAASFTQASGVKVNISAGATGLLYAQVRHGAPFDILMAADAERPKKLEEAGLTIPGTRRSYAQGRLVAWVPTRPSGSPSSNSSQEKNGSQENNSSQEKNGSQGKALSLAEVKAIDFPLAVANPALAPYGLAALQVIDQLMPVRPKLIRAANAAQAISFVATGNARGGLVPLSYMRQAQIPQRQWWLVPESLHQPIDQQLVALKKAPPSHLAWLRFLRSDEARQMIAEAGYRLPPADLLRSTSIANP